jgi:DNA-binding SARP family transcriptional activator
MTLYVVGPLRLIGRDGIECTPRGRKACALLALLAFAPGHKRPRKWLQDKLWSDRGAEQGAESLRQTLTEIRRAMGPESGCLLADRQMICLDRNGMEVNASAPYDSGDRDASELLEGLDIRDPEFEDWLRDQRMRFETEREKAAKATPAHYDQPAQIHPVAHAGLPQLVLEQPQDTQSQQEAILTNSLTDLIAKTISEIGTVEVLDHRDGAQERYSHRPGSPSPTALVVQTSVLRNSHSAGWRILLSEAASNRVVWTATAQQRNAGVLNADDPSVLGQLNQIADIAIGALMASCASHGEPTMATFLCRQGIRRLFRLSEEDFAIADRLFANAFDVEPRGIYLAWRAYLRTFLLMERKYTCRQTLIEEALAFMYRAVEIEPLNSYVAGISAHVNNTMRRSYVAGYEMAQRSIQLNRANALAWACLGMAECYLGKTKTGVKHTLMARDIAGGTPFRFHIDGLACIASAMVGDVERAIWCGEASHALAPQFAPPLRYLSALYLFHGDERLSQDAVLKLQALEPDFSYDLLREASYPAAGLQRSKLLEVLPGRQV